MSNVNINIPKPIIDYEDLDNKPTLVTEHSELILDDGTNPHGTTATDVGLGNVDNTSDLDKPISTATQTALDLKADITSISAVGFSNDYEDLDNKPTIPTILDKHSQLTLDDGTNPHGTTATDVGLGNVDNTSDLDKPISTATQTALDGKVPYTGATQNVDLGEFGADAGFVTLDTTPTNTPATKGTLSWSEDDNALQVVLNGYKQVVGGDTFYPVKNQTGSNIAKGVAVQFAGTLGASGRLLIAPFVGDGSVPSSFFMGVTAESIANGEDGKVLWFGRIRGLNTSAFSAGDILYASTTNAGQFQTSVPQAPNNIVQVAAVVNSHPNQGVIFVRPTIGSNINKDEGVLINAPTDKQVLQYDNASGLWVNGVDLNLATFTVELIDDLTVDFYAPDDLKINSTTVISGSGVVTLEVNNAAYSLGNVIQQGDKITVTVDTASVVNLIARYE